MDVKFYLVTIISLFIAIYSWRMPSSEINNRFGIRCKWSMYNSNTWKKSNWVATILINLCSIFIIAAGFCVEQKSIFSIFISAYIITTILSLFFAFVFYKSEVSTTPLKQNEAFYVVILLTTLILTYGILYIIGLYSFHNELIATHFNKNEIPDSFMSINSLFGIQITYMAYILCVSVTVSTVLSFLCRFNKENLIFTSNVLLLSEILLLNTACIFFIYSYALNLTCLKYISYVLSLIFTFLWMYYVLYIIKIILNKIFFRHEN